VSATTAQVDSSPGELTCEPMAPMDLAELYRAHGSFVWRNARRLGCDDSLADDVVHEVFLVVARRLGEFRHESSVQTWLFAITYRAVHRILRDHARYGRRLRDYAVTQLNAPSVSPHARSEAAYVLHHLLGKLNECQRVVFILAELEGFTSKEIGELLGVKPPTIDSRLRSARITLSQLLAREENRHGRAAR
jgi:RNA polymerase sigma-70 factor, ECF subfamily